MDSTRLVIVATVYTLLSVVTFVTYGLDKRAAVRGARRVPEARLHVLELVGGWPGALLAQRAFRHKSRKTSYRVVTWCIVALHIGAWAWLAARA